MSKISAAAFPAAAGPGRAPRDLRLDFFRGLAMFIILLAHTPGNPWTLWIPARFGFSDATEIFVFCSGFASALAFGASFRDRGFGLGAARVGFRVWQVYWAHVGLVIAVTALMLGFDASGLGPEGKRYLASLPLVPWTDRFETALPGLLTLSWVPNYFDILPMYLAILAMIPAAMAAHRVGGARAVAALSLGLWALGQSGALDLPSRPWAPEIPWFFNPFCWQLVFFTGFGFGMGWIPAPPRSGRLAWIAALGLLAMTPLAWWKLHEGVWAPGAVGDAIAAARAAIMPLWVKTEFGFLRWVHFLALAYLAWLWAGEAGARLRAPLRLPGAARGRVLAGLGLGALLTAPYAWAQEIRAASPALDAATLHLYGDLPRGLFGVDLLASDRWIGLPQILHGALLAALLWSLIGARLRERAATRGWALLVDLVRRVGSQSLAVFLVSMALAQAMGFLVDLVGGGAWIWAVVNAAGFAILVAVAAAAGWFKRQPWRGRTTAAPAPGATPGPREPAPDPHHLRLSLAE